MGNCNTKCSFCQDKNDSNHDGDRCMEPVTCTCKCCVGGNHDAAQKVSAISGGIALTGLGIGMCLLSGGLAAPFVGAAVAGCGVSSAANGITKTVNEEKMDAADYFIDVGVGAGSGLITAGGGAIASTTGNMVVKKVAQEGVKLAAKEVTKKVAVKTAVMATAGLAQAALSEGINCSKPLEKEKEKRGETRKFNPHCLWVGAAVGGLGAAGSSLSKGAANKVVEGVEKGVQRGVSKCATRFVGEALTGTAKGAVTAAGEVAAKGTDFNKHDLWAGALTNGVSSLCRDATDNFIKCKAPKPESYTKVTGKSTNGGKRLAIRAGSAVVETAATEGIEQARQAAIGEDDETRHFGKSFSIGLFESMNNKLGRYSEKHSTRKFRERKEAAARKTKSLPSTRDTRPADDE